MRYFILIVFVFPLVWSSCTAPEIELSEASPNLFRNGNFENQLLAHDLWSNQGEGTFDVQADNAYEGKYAMRLQPESCIELVYNDQVYVEAGRQYELSLAVQMAGDPTNCSGDLIMYVYQDAEILLQFNLNKVNAENWVLKKYYLTPVADSPLHFEIISGVVDTYLDDIRLMQVPEFH
ncbi:MAG: carbohydrate binding domain-containing protein [Chitinophagales bacterium]